MRGEYKPPAEDRAWHPELPPRARRILRACAMVSSALGTTSACAENTDELIVTWHGHRNYLRVRGEYQWNPPHHPHLGELPPRARRIRRFLLFLQGKAGTTSAYAENTSASLFIKSRTWNYLRVRGEYDKPIMHHAGHGELPPRARRILLTASII